MKTFSTISLVMILAFGFVYSSQPGNEPDKKNRLTQEELSELKPECPYLQEKAEKNDNKSENACPYLREQNEQNQKMDNPGTENSEINEFHYIRTFKSKYT